ncbi:MAG: type III pantothenate kinase [Acutalibacteraceae bacterium]
MLLTIDIGNTNLSIGAFDGDELKFVSRLATDRSRTDDQYAIELQNIFVLYGYSFEAFDGCAISSVVPELTGTLESAAVRITGKAPLILGPGVKTGINILADDPSQAGADLVAASVAAANLYELPCFVIDLGTATKINVIDESGSFCGCAIAPGVGISLEALSTRTSQLPAISLSTPKKAIGTNSIDCMQSGVVFGTAAMLDGLCDRMEKELGRKVKSFVATGGLSREIIKSCNHDIIHDAELVLKGLRIIYGKNRK